MHHSPMLIPGQLFHTFRVVRRTANVAADGSLYYTDTDDGMICAAFARASQTDITRFKQLNHPVSYKLVTFLTVDIQPGDVLVREDQRLYVRAVNNCGGMGMYTAIYCEYRPDAANPLADESIPTA